MVNRGQWLLLVFVTESTLTCYFSKSAFPRLYSFGVWYYLAESYQDFSPHLHKNVIWCWRW